MPVPTIPLDQRPKDPQKAKDARPETLLCCYKAYKYQPIMTPRLDELNPAEVFNQARINEIVLWKVNRYAELSQDTLEAVDAVKTLKRGQHLSEIGLKALDALLRTKGVDLAMASTILRFRNPEVFQIIDKRAYRTVLGKKLKLPTNTPKKAETIAKHIKLKVEVYEEYMQEIAPLVFSKALRFKDMDRALYVYDKNINVSLQELRE